MGTSSLPALRTAYRLELADGRWAASFEPMQAVVPLGESNARVVLEQGEDGYWRLGENIVQSGHRVTTDARTAYRLILDSGRWTAIFDPRRIVIQLGNSETSVTATQAQDGSYRLGDAILAEGLVHRVGSTGATYVISTAEDGAWRASYRPAEQVLRLGGPALATLVRAEDGTWLLDGQPVANGDLVTTETGNTYRLELAGNTWQAIFQPVAAPIHGTGLVALSTESGRDYRVGESATLSASGEGDVEVDGALFHVWREDGDLHGARFDLPPQGTTAAGGNFKIHLDEVAQLSRDRRDTLANEDRTELEIAGTAFSLGELLGTGSASVAGEGIAEKARRRIEGLRSQAEVLSDVFADDVSTLHDLLRHIWIKAQYEVSTIFGRGAVELRRNFPTSGVVRGLQAVDDAPVQRNGVHPRDRPWRRGLVRSRRSRTRRGCGGIRGQGVERLRGAGRARRDAFRSRPKDGEAGGCGSQQSGARYGRGCVRSLRLLDRAGHPSHKPDTPFRGRTVCGQGRGGERQRHLLRG